MPVGHLLLCSRSLDTLRLGGRCSQRFWGWGVQLGWEGFMLAQCHAGYHARWSALSRASVLQGQESWGVW